MKMRSVSRFLTSSVLVMMGGVVMLTSLQARHVRSSFAAELAPSSLPLPMRLPPSRLLDKKMPGTALYMVDRGQERLRLNTVSSQDLPRVLLERSQERSKSAVYALQAGDEHIAFSTLSKGFVYLHRAAALCREQKHDCQVLPEQFFLVGDELSQAGETLKENASRDDIRARIDSLQAELEAVLSSFISTT